MNGTYHGEFRVFREKLAIFAASMDVKTEETKKGYHKRYRKGENMNLENYSTRLERGRERKVVWNWAKMKRPWLRI